MNAPTEKYCAESNSRALSLMPGMALGACAALLNGLGAIFLTLLVIINVFLSFSCLARLLFARIRRALTATRCDFLHGTARCPRRPCASTFT